MLSTFISGKAIETLREKSDQEVVDMCLECLRSMFKVSANLFNLNLLILSGLHWKPQAYWNALESVSWEKPVLGCPLGEI